MERKLPGTSLPCPPDKERDPFSVLEPVFALSGGGLQLAQLCELTGLTSGTIQNWVKRGWVDSPVNKKYNEPQVARVLILNLLRDAMQLDHIAQLLRYINGAADNREDDSLPDARLYSLLCVLLFRLEDDGHIRGEELTDRIREELAQHASPLPDAEDRLVRALTVMLWGREAVQAMQRAHDLYNAIITEEGGDAV